MQGVRTRIAELNSRAQLRLAGEHASEFLNNLVTCDVLALKVGDLGFGALLTPQGKILFDFLVLRTGNGFLLDTDQSQRDALMKRLAFYKLRARVEIAADDGKVFAAWPGGPDMGHKDPRHGGLGHRIYDEAPTINASEADWHRKRIEIGIPQSGQDFELESIFPHDALMDQFPGAGVNFTKGCYVGQEVVSRMQHRGTARNRFMKLSCSSQNAAELPTAGTELISSERVLGKMGSHIGNRGLALVRLDRAAEALQAQEAVLTGGIEVVLEKPDFVSFPWP